MNSLVTFLVCLLSILYGIGCVPTPTSRDSTVALTAGDLHATIYLPNEKSGIYRASRFDWSGMIGELRLGDQVFWNEWNPSTDPEGDHDNAVGPAMEFGMDAPLGYDEARPGQGFVKVGVGVLQRTDAGPYFFRNRYPLLKRGESTVEISTDARSATFRQNLRYGNYGYLYEKIVSLFPDRTLRIACKLTNAGKDEISTVVYAHDFYRLSNCGWTTNLMVRFDRPVSLPPEANGKEVSAHDGSLVVDRLIPISGSVWLPLAFSKGATPRSYSISNEQLKLTNTLDFESSKFVLYGLPECLCVEPFLEIQLAPGQKREWSYTYRFEQLDATAVH